MEDIQMPSAPACANCSSTAVVEGFSTPLCQPCREALIKYPVPLGVKLFAGIILAVMLVSLVAFPRRFTLGLHIEKGKKAIQERKYLTANREFTPVAAAYPQNEEWQAYLMLSTFYLERFRDFSGHWEKIGHAVIEDQKLLKRLNAIADQFVGFYPSDSLLALTANYTMKGQVVPDTAYEHYLQSHPDEIYAYMEYAKSLVEKGRLTTSDSLLKLVLAKDGSYWPAMRMEAAVQRELGNWEEALRYCDQVLRINQEAAFSIAAKARIHLRQHHDKEGLQYALESMEVDKDDVYCSSTLALAYHYNNQPQKRDALIRALQQGDSTAQDAARRTLDIVEQKETFRN